ncbi:MAG: DMT family transporter [Sulfitobacter sp.]
MASISTENRPGRAIALKLCSIFLFIVMSALVKAASEEVNPGQAVFFRSFFAFPMVILWLWQQHDLKVGLVPHRFWGHVWRGIFGTAAMAMTFGGLALLPLPEVTAIGYATPLFTVLLAALLLGEKIRVFRLSAVGLGLIGVMIVMYPRLSLGEGSLSDAGRLGVMLVLGASAMRGLVQIHVRRLVQTEHTAAIVFYFSLTATVLSFLTWPLGMIVPFEPFIWVWPSGKAAFYLISAGLIGGVAQILVTSSYRFAGASMLAPFDYASMIFATLIGWVIFDEVPTVTILIGASLVIAGGVLIIWRERQLGLDRSKSKATVSPPGTT